MIHHQLVPLIVIVSLALGSSGCADTVSVVIAPRLGQTTDCLEYFLLPKSAADWLARHPEPAPPEWYQWEDWLADKVKFKLDKDCE